MEQKSKPIQEFEPGDIVTRVEPVVNINSGGVFSFGSTITEDGNYIGEKLIFLGIINGCAYFEPTDSFTKQLEKGNPISLKLYKYSNGWSHYIDPLTLIDSKPISRYESLSDTTLINKREEAISNEDYEEASRIQHEIDKREL